MSNNEIQSATISYTQICDSKGFCIYKIVSDPKSIQTNIKNKDDETIIQSLKIEDKIIVAEQEENDQSENIHSYNQNAKNERQSRQTSREEPNNENRSKSKIRLRSKSRSHR